MNARQDLKSGFTIEQESRTIFGRLVPMDLDLDFTKQGPAERGYSVGESVRHAARDGACYACDKLGAALSGAYSAASYAARYALGMIRGIRG